MPLPDWMLEANEEENMNNDPNNLNPTNDPFREFIINSLFIDVTEYEHETNTILKLYKNSEKRN